VARPLKSPSIRRSPSRGSPVKTGSSGPRTSALSGARHRTSASSSLRSSLDQETGTPRRRRDAVTARIAILDATERHLVLAGPSGIRLQEVAADAGVSHPTVLHHFGTRERLVKAVITRSLASINAGLAEAISRSTGDVAQVAAMLDSVFDALAHQGRARVIMWLALEAQRIEEDAQLAAVVEATHALRKSKRTGKGRTPSREDTAHVVVLATLALVGAAVMGPALLENAGLSGDAAAQGRFRRWLASVLAKHLDET
jgi:AcrR family transcriptional regulator